MPRKRVISPEFWTDPKIMDLSPLARLLFVGCWNFADDKGVLEASPKKLKAQVLPCDELDVLSLITELLNHGLLREFQINGNHYWHVRHFLRWQRVEKPSKSELPPPPEDDQADSITQPFVEESGRSRGGVSPKISKDKLSEDKIREVKHEAADAAASPEILTKDEAELRHALPFLSKILSGAKMATDDAVNKWRMRRVKYSARELIEAFDNLSNDPDHWWIKNHGWRPLSWWLSSDARIEEMKHCHLRRSSSPKLYVAD